MLAYHNLGQSPDNYPAAQLLIVTCMDFRVHLNIPDRFAYVIRTGGSNIQKNEFHIAYALSLGGIRSIALIGHTDCGMVNLNDRRTQYIEGLVEITHWGKEKAEAHFSKHAPQNEIGDVTEFILSEAKRLNSLFPNVICVPLLYRVEDQKLSIIEENTTA
jgi:carbonic anhydrase